jgi:hypothetical protein
MSKLSRDAPISVILFRNHSDVAPNADVPLGVITERPGPAVDDRLPGRVLRRP